MFLQQLYYITWHRPYKLLICIFKSIQFRDQGIILTLLISFNNIIIPTDRKRSQYWHWKFRHVELYNGACTSGVTLGDLGFGRRPAGSHLVPPLELMYTSFLYGYFFLLLIYFWCPPQVIGTPYNFCPSTVLQSESLNPPIIFLRRPSISQIFSNIWLPTYNYIIIVVIMLRLQRFAISFGY